MFSSPGWSGSLEMMMMMSFLFSFASICSWEGFEEGTNEFLWFRVPWMRVEEWLVNSVEDSGCVSVRAREKKRYGMDGWIDRARFFCVRLPTHVVHGLWWRFFFVWGSRIGLIWWWLHGHFFPIVPFFEWEGDLDMNGWTGILFGIGGVCPNLWFFAFMIDQWITWWLRGIS